MSKMSKSLDNMDSRLAVVENEFRKLKPKPKPEPKPKHKPKPEIKPWAKDPWTEDLDNNCMSSCKKLKIKEYGYFVWIDMKSCTRKCLREVKVFWNAVMPRPMNKKLFEVPLVQLGD